MAARAESIITAGLRPELFAERGVISASRTLLIASLAVLVVAGFGLRLSGLSAAGLSEDELNKLEAVADYREHGLTAANSEHPMLMKALQTGTVFLAEKWNSSSFVSTHAGAYIQTEAALRSPSAVFGSLTILLIYLLTAELFGAEVGLIAAALWAFDPTAIGFNRIAKEDTFLLFFFLLGNVFWLRGQRVTESQPARRPEPYYWAAAASFGAMLASKYLPQMLAVSFSYYWIFQSIPSTRWRLGKKRILIFFLIMATTFLLLNPAIVLPATWRQMGLFAGQKLVAHDAYEFMGSLYSHRMTDWLKGIPWYFYYVLIAVKLPVLTLAGCAIGLPLLFKRKIGDGRYFILFWMFFWLITFSFVGGKFTRYFTVALPAVLITAAIGVQFVARWIAQRLSTLVNSEAFRIYARLAVSLVVVVASLKAAANVAPHFRLYTNVLGGGAAKAGYYFPHDEFYDASVRDVMFEIARRARPGAQIASESSTLASYYAKRAGRPDLVCVNLSDPRALKQLREGDFIIDARGRRYFSNQAIISALEQASSQAFRMSLGPVPSASVYQLDKHSLETVVETARTLPPLAKRFTEFKLPDTHF